MSDSPRTDSVRADPMRIDIVSIFPEYLDPLRMALLGKAIDKGAIEVGVHDLRDWTHDVHRAVDDSPYGGGPGMVMQETAQRYSREKHLVFACGRYEGIDQRVFDDAARRVRVEEVSLGDFVLIGGEVAAMAMIEATVRLIDGVLGNPRSHEEDSFSDGLLEGPSYTRPVQWRGLDVPPVLLSGDHAKVAAWRHEQSLERTRERRPDLLDD